MEMTGYSALWKAVIRPPRYDYNPEDLGDTEFGFQKRNYKRTDIKIVSS